MYVGYVDESGFVGRKKNPDQPVQVMACILPAAYNLPRTIDEFEMNIKLLRAHNIPLTELKAEDMYSGWGAWERVEGEVRHQVFTGYFDWLAERRHKIVLSLIDNSRFFEEKKASNRISLALDTPYLAGALHVALAVQRFNQRKADRKGMTILVFDEQREFEDRVAELVSHPPGFTDEYYGYRPEHGRRLNQIIDTAYFVKSQHSFLVQIADTVAFVFRRYLQLISYDSEERFDGEMDRILGWRRMLEERLALRSHSYPPGKSGVCTFYREIAPAGWDSLWK